MPAIAADCAVSGASSPTQDSNRSPRMYKASASPASVARKLKNCSVIAGRVASMCKSEMKSAATWALQPPRLRAGDALDSFDHHGLERRVFLEGCARAGRNVADPVDHIHALNDLAEYCIAPSGFVGVERLIVEEIHVELRVAAMRILGAGHADRASLIRQAVAGFIDHFCGRGHELVIAVEAAALDDEIGDDAVKSRARIVSLIHVFQEMRDGERSPLGVQFQSEISHGSKHLNEAGRRGLGGCGGLWRSGRGGRRRRGGLIRKTQ